MNLCDTDLNAAYALLVAGIETLSNRYGSFDVPWERWDQAPRFDKLFVDQQLTEAQAKAIRGALLDGRILGLRQRFATYASTRLPDAWWSTEIVQDYTPSTVLNHETNGLDYQGVTAGERVSIDRYVPADRATLRRRLLASYDARSTYVHDGVRDVRYLATVVATVGQAVKPKEPLEFIGIRRLLRALIGQE